MSRAVTRRNQRAAAERNQDRWLADLSRAERQEAERARLASRMAELSTKLRVGQYLGRAADIAELDALWLTIARRPT